MKYAMDYWARRVKDDTEIPDSFQSFFAMISSNRTQFPYTIFAPPEKWYRRKSTPKLLCLLDEVLYVAEKIKKQIKVTCFPFQDINYLETGTLLLHSWLKINGIVDGRLTTVMIEYNTVVEEVFRPLIAAVRASIHNLDQSELARGQLKQEQRKFDYLIRENFKYMNFGKRSLIPGEQVQQILLQPDIRGKFLRFFQRTLSFTHLTILTDHELIIVKDDDSLKPAQQMRYGGIWQFIPLSKISKLVLESNPENDLINLTVMMPEEVSITALFSADQKRYLELLAGEVERFKKIPQRECV